MKRTKQHNIQAVSPMRAAQFLQVENPMALFVDICVASEIPRVEQRGKAMPAAK